VQAQDKPASSGALKIGFLMDSLKVERWQTDLDKFQKRAAELGADGFQNLETIQKSLPWEKWPQ
jgi:ABC-type xylose transport system substrate-binding protein